MMIMDEIINEEVIFFIFTSKEAAQGPKRKQNKNKKKTQIAAPESG